MPLTKPIVRPSAHLAELAKELRHASHVHHTATQEGKTAAEVALYAAAIQYGDEFREAEESFYAHVRPEMRALAERPQKLTWAEYKDIRANSYERRLLHQNLDDEALCALYELCEKNAGRQPLGRLELAELDTVRNRAVARRSAASPLAGAHLID